MALIRLVQVGLPPPVRRPGEKTKHLTEADRLTSAWQFQYEDGKPLGVGLFVSAEVAESYAKRHGWQAEAEGEAVAATQEET